MRLFQFHGLKRLRRHDHTIGAEMGELRRIAGERALAARDAVEELRQSQERTRAEKPNGHNGHHRDED